MPENKQKNIKLAKEWFVRAQDDELSIEDILEDRGGSPNTVCFLAQQMAEKYLKGFLVYHQNRFPKIHQLDRLVTLSKEIEPGFEKLRKEAEESTEFYIATRYPGDYPRFSFKDAEDAFEKTCKVKNSVLKRVKD